MAWPSRRLMSRWSRMAGRTRATRHGLHLAGPPERHGRRSPGSANDRDRSSLIPRARRHHMMNSIIADSSAGAPTLPPLLHRRRNGSIDSTAARHAKQPRFSSRQPLGRLPHADKLSSARADSAGGGWSPGRGRPPPTAPRRLQEPRRPRDPSYRIAAAVASPVVRAVSRHAQVVKRPRPWWAGGCSGWELLVLLVDQTAGASTGRAGKS